MLSGCVKKSITSSFSLWFQDVMVRIGQSHGNSLVSFCSLEGVSKQEESTGITNLTCLGSNISSLCSHNRQVAIKILIAGKVVSESSNTLSTGAIELKW